MPLGTVHNHGLPLAELISAGDQGPAAILRLGATLRSYGYFGSSWIHGKPLGDSAFSTLYLRWRLSCACRAQSTAMRHFTNAASLVPLRGNLESEIRAVGLPPRSPWQLVLPHDGLSSSALNRHALRAPSASSTHQPYASVSRSNSRPPHSNLGQSLGPCGSHP